MKRILVACGNGIATSTMVTMKIKKALEDANLKANFTQCKLMEIPSKAPGHDLIVTTGKYDHADFEIPVVNAVSLLSGIGADATLDEILNYIKE